jgi:predicted Fe-Mo cluster-binding NifX family protein
MKVAVSSTGPTLQDQVDPRFGRCAYFLIVNPDTMEFEALPNTNAELGGGAGIQSAKLVMEKGATSILTGSCGPNAVQVFEQGSVHVVTGVSGMVTLAVQQFAAGSLKAADTPAGGRFPGGGGRGMGGGGGRGMGGGGGRGMGGGGGRGMGGGGGRGMGGGMGGGRRS